MTTKLFGEPVQRVEDEKLVTGLGRYLDDELIVDKGELTVPEMRPAVKR